MTKIQALTLWQAVPNIQPVILAFSFPQKQRVIFQVKGLEGECDLRLRRRDDDEGALQIMRVLVRETRRLDHSGWSTEITETVLSSCRTNRNTREMWIKIT